MPALVDVVRTELELAAGHPFRDVKAQPQGPGSPEIWVLGSSNYGAQVAAHFGLPYCFAHFITDGHGCAEAIALYRDSFRPSERNASPYASICVWAFAAARLCTYSPWKSMGST